MNVNFSEEIRLASDDTLVLIYPPGLQRKRDEWDHALLLTGLDLYTRSVH
jgi:hypothetical protein